MSTLVPGQQTWQWPIEVLDFAARHQVAAYLDPLLEATRQVFQTARELKVLLEADPEIHDDWHIVFEVCVPSADLLDYLQAQHRWTGELYRVCPAPLVRTFRPTLIPVG